MYALYQMVEENRVCFPRVRAPQQNEVSVFNFAIRACPPTCSEYRRQTGDAGGMSSPVAAINVVGAHDTANEPLRRVIQFVSSLGATEHAKVPGIVFLDGFAERRRNPVQGFIPRSGTMQTIFAYQRLGQAGFRWSWHIAPKTGLIRIVALGHYASHE